MVFSPKYAVEDTQMPSGDKQKSRARLRSYEGKLRTEKKEYGFYRDGAGKRYHIGPLYLLLGDNEGALAAFQWFEKEFPDDVGEPGHGLCWSLALYRAGNELGAAKKLRHAMLANLYLLPHLLGSSITEIAMWHGSSDAWASSSSGSLLAAPSPHYPAKFLGYEQYKLKFLPNQVLENDIHSLIAAMTAKKYPEAYFIVTRSQQSFFYIIYGYSVENWESFETALLDSGYFATVYSNEDAKIFKYAEKRP